MSKLVELDHVERYLETLYRRKITQDFDQIVLVIGDEGYGKSTFMLEATALWQRIRGQDPTVDSILDRVVWGGKDDFKTQLADSEPESIITVQDAARVLYKKDAMMPEQKELEKDLLDIRFENYVILLGFQYWKDVPSQLQTGRAKSTLFIPRRGAVWGFSRDAMDERVAAGRGGEWPEPDLRDEFPSLEGTALWDRFTTIDSEKKRERLSSDDEEDSGPEPQTVVDEILDAGAAQYVEENEFNGQVYVSKPLIQLDYPGLSNQEAEQVQHGIRREVEIAELAAADQGGEGESHV